MHEQERSTNRPLFKTYNQHQMMLLPPSLDELVPENHLVRVVNDAIEHMDIEPLINTYKGGGTTSYHPLMMLKVLIYAYTCQIYGIRRIAKALRENVHFMWLAGGNRPNFRTLNLFRNSRLKKTIEEIFASLLEHLIESGYVKLDDYFVDGTKLRADAGRYTYVWSKNTNRYKAGVQKKIKELLKHIDEVNEAEDKEYGDRDLEEMGEASNIDSEKLGQIAKELSEKLKNSEQPDPKIKKAKRIIEKDYLPRLRKYEQQEGWLNGRNSCSKTDPDATFFRFKNDELLPAYNLMVGTENQFILNWSVHQHPTDTVSLIPHLNKFKRLTGRKLPNCMGDSGFGSEENYLYLDKHSIENYLKFNTFHKEEKIKKDNPFHRDNFIYHEDTDSYECPQNRTLPFKEQRVSETSTGYQTELTVYECTDCSGCPEAAKCRQGDSPRTLTFSKLLEKYKAQARENLNSPEGIELRKRRGVDVESVFGHIKQNQGYTRFRLRGLEKVNIEAGLLSIAHNLMKMFNIKEQKLLPV